MPVGIQLSHQLGSQSVEDLRIITDVGIKSVPGADIGCRRWEALLGQES